MQRLDNHDGMPNQDTDSQALAESGIHLTACTGSYASPMKNSLLLIRSVVTKVAARTAARQIITI